MPEKEPSCLEKTFDCPRGGADAYSRGVAESGSVWRQPNFRRKTLGLPGPGVTNIGECVIR